MGKGRQLTHAGDNKYAGGGNTRGNTRGED